VQLPHNLTLGARVNAAAGFSMHSQGDVIIYQNGIHPKAAELAAELDDPNTSVERREEIARFQAGKVNTIWGNWIHDGDFIRFQEVSLRYRVPSSFATRFGLDNLAVNLTMENLGLWTKWPGVADPGTASQRNTPVLITDQRMSLPLPRTLTINFQGGW
jgi:hypothetical protein